MNLHQDKEAFEALLSDISRRTGIRMDIIEKDYYLTLWIRLRPEHFYNHRGNHHRNRREYQYPDHKDLHPTLSRLRDLRNRRTNYKHPISGWNEYINLPITEIIHTINLPIQ